MKRAVGILTAILLMCSISIQAQMRMSHEERVKQYQERLKLNEKQTKTVDTLLTKMENKMQDLFSNSNGDRSSMRDEMRKIMDGTNNQIEKILTPTQKAEFKKMLEERRARMQQMMGGGNNQ